MQTEYLYKKQQILFTETLPITRKTLKATSIRESDAILQSILDGAPYHPFTLLSQMHAAKRSHATRKMV